MTNPNTNQSPFELDPEVMDLFKRMKADSLVSLEQSRADMWGALQSLMPTQPKSNGDA